MEANPDILYYYKRLLIESHLELDPKEYNRDAWYSCDRLFMCLNSKFDELKQFHFKRFKENLPIFWNVWNFSQM